MASVKKNLGWNILLTVSGYLFPLITFPYITRVLGADNLGITNFALSIVDYAILFSTLGLVTIGYRYIPQCNDDINKRNHVFNHLVTLHLILTLTYVLEFKHIRNGQQALMVFRKFGSQHSSEGKTFAGVGIVRDGDQVSLRVIADGMDARHFATPDMRMMPRLRSSGSTPRRSQKKMPKRHLRELTV